jgi:lambda family phage portal protein
VFQSKHTRRFDGAAGGRRWSSNPTFHDINAEILTAAMPVRRRAAYYARNNAWATNGVSSLVANLVGAGIRPASQHPDPKVRALIAKAWARWCRSADADGLTDFYGLQACAVRQMIEGGECFSRFETESTSLKVRLLDPDMVDLAITRELDGNRRIVGGVEFDAQGRRTAYWVSPKRPGQLFTITMPPIRIPAADMTHLFAPLAPGQVRGVSWLAPILLRLHEIDQYEDAQLVRQKVSAMFAGFITDQQGGASATFEGQQTGSVLESGIEPGMLKVLPQGLDIKFSDPASVGDTVEFLRLQLRSVAAGLGVPDHLLTGDLSQVNYSSIRAGLVEFRRRIELLQYSVIIHQFCMPIWRRFIIGVVLSGAIDAPDFESSPDDYLAVEWYPPTQEWVDPFKDAQAEALAVANGFKSRRQVVMERGYDIETLDEEIAADHAREKKLGLDLSAGLRPPSGVPPQENANAPNS